MSEKESMISKIRNIMRELGPLGMLALVAATVIFINLIGIEGGSGLLGNTGSEMSNVELRDRAKVTALFEPIEGVTVEEVIISYDLVTESSSTLFASVNQTNQVSSGVVVLYQGTIHAQYDVTRAISLLLDVPFHQIELMNISNLGGN